MKLNDIQKSALVCALFGLGLIILFSISGKVLPHSELTQVQGKIDWVKATGKHGDNLRFKFINNDIHLIYHSIGGQTSKTHPALTNCEVNITNALTHSLRSLGQICGVLFFEYVCILIFSASALIIA